MTTYWIHTAKRCPDRHVYESMATVQARASRRTWIGAERDLRAAWDRYGTCGSVGALYRDAVIRPIHDRFNSGERSLALLREIWNL